MGRFCGGMNITKYFIDTNILWWYFTKNSKNHKIVKKYLDPLIMDLDNQFYVNEFVIIELLHLLIKKSKGGYKLGKELLSNKYPFLHILFNFSNLTSIISLLEVLNTCGHDTTIGGRDSSIIVSMQTHQINDIITNDGGFKSVANLRILNPITN